MSENLACPECGSTSCRVKDSRPHADLTAIRRRRLCGGCGYRFTTLERIVDRRLTTVGMDQLADVSRALGGLKKVVDQVLVEGSVDASS